MIFFISRRVISCDFYMVIVMVDHSYFSIGVLYNMYRIAFHSFFLPGDEKFVPSLGMEGYT